MSRKPNLLDVIVYLGCVLVAVCLMWGTFHSGGGTLRIATKAWSDFAAHIPLIRSFSYGQNVPVEYPTFAGAPIRYHFLFYALVGILEKSGLNLSFALNTLSALGFALLLIMLYRYGYLLFRQRLAGILAIILFLCNGSLSFLEFFRTTPINSNLISVLIHNTRFPSFGPWDGHIVAAFWNLNIYTNQRHLGLSFGISLWLLYPFIEALVAKVKKPKAWRLVAMGCISLVLPWLHQAAALMVALFLLCLFIIHPRRLKPIFIPLILILTCLLPGIIYYASLGNDQLAYHLGFLATDTSALGLLLYWWHNLGLYLLLIPLIAIFSPPRPRTLLIPPLLLFGLANLIKLSPDIINNHKLINFALIFWSLFIAGFLSYLFHRRLLHQILAAILLFFLTFSGIVDMFPIINDTSIEVVDIPQNTTAAWIAAHTPPQSVFVTTTYLYNPASLSGRKTILDYGYFNWSMGYNETNRREALPVIFSPSVSKTKVCSTLLEYGVDYVLVAPGKGDIGLDPSQSQLVSSFIPDFSAPDGYTIFNVSLNCQNI